MHYTFPGVPLSTQHLYRCTSKGMYMQANGIQMKHDYQWQLKAKPRHILNGEIKVVIEIYFKDHRKQDVDNFNKLILDAGNNIIWQDDSQIVDLTVRKFIDTINPRVELYIYEHFLQSQESGTTRQDI